MTDLERRIARLEEAYIENMCSPDPTAATKREQAILAEIEREHAAREGRGKEATLVPVHFAAPGPEWRFACGGFAFERLADRATVDRALVTCPECLKALTLAAPGEVARLRAIEAAARAWAVPMREKHRLLDLGVPPEFARIKEVKAALGTRSLDLLAALEGTP